MEGEGGEAIERIGNERKEEEEDHDDQPQTFKEMVAAWPKVTFFIIGNEFCERFSFYGMRSVLTIYLINYLGFASRSSTVFFHAFTLLAYTFPLFGSMLADGYIGKFWTIFSLSIVYAAGQITLAVASSFNAESSLHPWLDFIGLFIIAVGTGGIKPCVSAFGGDQFNKHYTRMISIFFSIFYFSINAGSTISMFLTPIFRSIPCLGQTSCFPLAFGIPALLMLVATALFMLGSFWYKKSPPTENVIMRVIKTVKTALVNKARSGSEKREHWLDHAMDGHSCEESARCIDNEACAEAEFVKDVKSLVRVIVMMSPFPMFWALYDQQGSRWTIQAMKMNAHIFGNVYLLPDQMQVLNAIMILVFIPLFQLFVYPSVERCGIRTTSLRRMAAGGLLAALSFVLCALVQLAIERSEVPPVAPHHAHVAFVNTYPEWGERSCNFTLNNPDHPDRTVSSNELIYDDQSTLLSMAVPSSPPSFTLRGTGNDCPIAVPILVPIQEQKTYAVLLTQHGYVVTESPTDKPQKGRGEFGLSIILDLRCSVISQNASWAQCDDEVYTGPVAICKEGSECQPGTEGFYAWDETAKRAKTQIQRYDGSESLRSIVTLPRIDVEMGKYNLYFVNDTNGTLEPWQFHRLENFTIDISEMGSVYTAIAEERGIAALHRAIPPNSISILWQIPQYAVVTAGEILFSITGLEFAYSEAAPCLKSVVQAIYLLTVAVGDLIIIVIAQINLFNSMVTEMLVFAAAMTITIGIFILLSIYYYQYAHYDEDNQGTSEKYRKKK